jgi:hypothetical protein
MESEREPASAAAPQSEQVVAPAAPAATRPFGNSRGAAWATLARQAALQGGNRAALAILREQPETTEDMHKKIYGEGDQHPSAPPAYEFSDDPLADGGFEPDKSIRAKPGPMRAEFIKPKSEAPSGEWLQEALKKDPVLKALPDWARDKAIGALKDIDETAAEKIIDALPWDGKTKGAALAAIKALLETAKGRKFKLPEAPPNPRLPDWQKPIEPAKAPGETIFQLPPIKF